MGLTFEERFWAKVDKDGPNDCWLWTAHLNNKGYGHFSVDRRPRLAHRVSYELCIGPIPAGLVVDHLCRVTACVNPDHLEAVTQIENLRRAPGSGVGLTHCKKGHEFTPENTYVRPNGGRLCRICQGHRPWEEYRPELAERMRNLHRKK